MKPALRRNCGTNNNARANGPGVVVRTANRRKEVQRDRADRVTGADVPSLPA